MAEELTGEDKKFTVDMTEPGPCKRVLSIGIAAAELDREKKLITDKLRRDIKVPGFRKGKVPLSYITKNYGEVIEGDAVRNLLPLYFHQAIHELGLDPLGEPSFENLEVEDGIRFEASFEVKPDVTVRGYKGVEVEASKREIREQDIDETLDNLRERMASLEPVDRPAASSDYMIIDYVPLLESGEPDESARQPKHPVDLSSEQLLEEFRTGLLGLGPGDDTRIDVKYPDDFPEESLAGKTRTFAVKVLEVKEKRVPAADDAFAKQLGLESLEELRKKIRDDLVKEEQRRFEHDIEEKVIDRLIEAHPFEVPEIMVENYFRSVLEEDRRRRPQVADESQREQEVRELFKDAAVRTIKKYFIMESIKDAETIVATEEELERKVAELAEESGRPVDELKKLLLESERRRNFESELTDRKVLTLLRENARNKAA